MDVDHCKLEAIFPDSSDNQVLHYEYFSDTGPGPRKARIEKRWRRQECIGHGSYGDVWLEITEDEPGKKRAVKAIRTKGLGGKGDYIKEVKAMVHFSKTKSQQERCFVEFYGWFDNSKTDTVFLAMEYLPLGDLESHMTEPFTDSSVKEISDQLLHGLATMHAEGFTHRDLKPANVFVAQKSPSWWIKLGDFGITKRVQNSATALRTAIGTHDYMAPELFGYVPDQDEESSEYTNAVDLWAVGCVVFRLYTQQVPFPSRENLSPLRCYCKRIRYKETLFPEEVLQESKVGEGAAEFILRLLEPRPERRLTAEAALETAWLNSVEEDPSELHVVPGLSSLRLREQPGEEASMVKNYVAKNPSAHKKEIVQQPRRNLCPGLITGTEWGLLDPPNSATEGNERRESSSGSESDISEDIPAHLSARQTVRYKREYKAKKRKENPYLTPVWYDGAWVYPKYWLSKWKDKTIVAKDETKDTTSGTTVKRVNLLEQALTVRMPKLVPRTPAQLSLIDCPLSFHCLLRGDQGLENNEEVVKAHLVERHGPNWESMLKSLREAGWKKDERTLKPFDCPIAHSCGLSGKAGFGSVEEVMEHLKIHGHDNPKEGDLLVPVLRMG